MSHHNLPGSFVSKTRFNERKAAMSIITITLLLLAGVGSTLGTTYFYILNKDKVPAAQITNLTSEQALQAGPVEIRGTAEGEKGKIQAILVKVDEGPAVFATPNAIDDFSSWSALIEVPTSGTHNIEIEVVDSEGKTHSTTQSVTITEPAPSLAPPPEQVVEAAGDEGVYATYPAPEVKGDKSGVMDPECSPASGSLFPMGITEVTCIAHRGDGSALRANFTVTVRDSTPPTIEPPKDVIRKNSDNSVMNGWLGKPTVSDIVDDNPTISNDVPFYGFPIGTTAVVWTATDDYGNFAQAVQMVTIANKTIGSDEADGSTSASDSETPGSANGQSSGSGTSVTYGGGGGGGGGGGSSKGGNGKGNDDGTTTPPAPGGNSGNTTTASRHSLVITSVNLSGSPLAGMHTTIKSSSGTTLLTGYTPLTFIGNGSTAYIVTVSDNNTAVFDHWENAPTGATRTVTLNQNTTIIAYYENPFPPVNDTTSPSVTITNPTNGLIIVPGTLAVQGTSSDNIGGSGISTLQVRLDAGSYITATPKSVGDWSAWTVSFGALNAGQHTIHAKATDNAGNLEEVSVSVTAVSSPGDTNAPTVSASPLGGTYSSAKSITLSANEPATIYYTTNGINPTTSSQVYAAPISISATTTLKFVAKDTAGNVGAVTSQSYLIDTIAPSVTASPSGGTFVNAQLVSLSANEPATIYYTTNGNTPTITSSVYSSPITIASTTTLKYIARDAAGNMGSMTTQAYAIDTSLPTVTASPSGGLYSSSRSVTLSTSESATIYFTTNGNTPTTSSQVYSSPISISSTSTLKYFARDAAGNAGNVVTQVYTIDASPPTVTASPTGGTYSSSRSVTLSTSESATIYFTTSGATPTTASAIYSSSISIAATTTLKFMARDAAGNVGAVSSQTYVIDTVVPTVTASPSGGTFSSARSVTLSASEPATIYYTTNGINPTTSSQVYGSPISVSSTTLKYFARDAAGNMGSINTQTYTIDAAAPTVTASPLGGTFSSPRSVTLTASESATIYFTTNGNTPTTSSQVYSSPISISSTSTLKYFARDAAGNAGNVVTQVYTITAADTAVPSIAITQPAEGSVITVTGGQLLATGTASDSGSGIGTVQLRVDDGSYATATPRAPGDWSTWSITLPITSGQHRLVPRATDNAGNQAWNSIIVTVNDSSTPPPDPAAPDTRIDSVRDGSGVVMNNGQTTTSRSITILFSSPDTDVEVFEGRINSGNWSPITSPITLNGLATGQNRYEIRARDTAGNVDASPASITWTITVTPPPPPPPGGTLDPFGIAMLYPTAPGQDNEYYTKTNAATTTEFLDNGKVQRMSGFSRNADGTWNIDGGPRWVITGGWRNVEMTMQMKINSGSQVQFYANGEEHTTNNNGAWHGSANKMRMYASGSIGFVKELYHESGNSGYASTTATRSSGEGAITGKWVTVKYVGYNIDNDTHRKLEGYISMNNDNRFIKVSELVDNGNWQASSGFDSFMAHMRQNYPSVVPENRDTGQEMKRNEVITWEGGFVSFRCDGADYDFRNVSVREITAANGLIDPSVVQ